LEILFAACCRDDDFFEPSSFLCVGVERYERWDGGGQ